MKLWARTKSVAFLLGCGLWPLSAAAEDGDSFNPAPAAEEGRAETVIEPAAPPVVVPPAAAEDSRDNRRRRYVEDEEEDANEEDGAVAEDDADEMQSGFVYYVGAGPGFLLAKSDWIKQTEEESGTTIDPPCACRSSGWVGASD